MAQYPFYLDLEKEVTLPYGGTVPVVFTVSGLFSEWTEAHGENLSDVTIGEFFVSKFGGLFISPADRKHEVAERIFRSLCEDNLDWVIDEITRRSWEFAEDASDSDVDAKIELDKDTEAFDELAGREGGAK